MLKTWEVRIRPRPSSISETPWRLRPTQPSPELLCLQTSVLDRKLIQFLARQSNPIESYLVSVAFQRSAVIASALATENRLGFIVHQGGRLNVKHGGSLARIALPS